MLKQLGFQDKSFYKDFLFLTFPMALQNLLTTAVNMLDNVMIGQLGAVPIAAVGLANKVFFLYSIITFGLCGGGAVFINQFWGKKDTVGIKKVLFLNLILSVLFAFCFFVVAFFAPHQVMRILTNDSEAVQIGAVYLKTISVSYLMSAVIFAFSFFLKSMEKPRYPLMTALVSIVVNFCINYTLIFGKFGFPVLGVQGAAIGTVCARAVEMVLIVFLAFRSISFLRRGMREYLMIDRAFVGKYLKTSVPVIGNEGFWALGVTVMAAVYARVSTDAIAAINIVNLISDAASVFIFGASNAAAIIVGKQIGLKRTQQAYLYAARFSRLAPLLGLLFGLLAIGAAPLFIRCFAITDELSALAFRLTVIMAGFMPFRTFTLINIVGVLRSGGDTVFCFWTDFTGIWLIGVPFTAVSGLLLGCPIEVVYPLSLCEELVKSLIIIQRLKRGNWITDLVNE